MLHLSKYAAMTACLTAALALSGCPGLPGPLFNATGNYTGTWEDEVTGDACPIVLKLEHNVDTFFPLDHQILGTLEVSLGCFVPGNIARQLTSELPSLSIPVFGSMTPGTGKIKLGLDTEVFDLPFQVAVSFDGVGEPGSFAFYMDNYSGSYTFSLSIPTDVEGFEEINVESAGTFMVDISTGF
jgi:hypothetical protein